MTKMTDTVNVPREALEKAVAVIQHLDPSLQDVGEASFRALVGSLAAAPKAEPVSDPYKLEPLPLGTPVEVDFKEAEVGRQTLYVAGVVYDKPGMLAPEYWLSETWPVKCRGDVSTDWKRNMFSAQTEAPKVEQDADRDARSYIANWCPDFVKDYVDGLHPAPKVEQKPAEVTIFCPQCALPHVDEGEWATTRHHKTHQCQVCGHEWRPFPFATVGVTHPAPASDELLEALKPFVEKVGHFDSDHADDYCPDWSPFIPVSAYRRAANAYAKHKGPQS